MELQQLIQELSLKKHLTLDDIPKIDLYMDQVIQLFQSTYDETTRNDEEKVLTKTMINNYAKGKLLPPIKNKKYTRQHLILLSLIYQLKGSLSINDIKILLQPLLNESDEELEYLYEVILQSFYSNSTQFEEILKNSSLSLNTDLEKIVTVASLIHMSNQYRRLAETILDRNKAEEI